jgi:phosphatidylethanolamine/phosphatidyl-N-methylethanolamine N-methyltransferase
MRQRLTDYRVFWRQFREAYHSTGAVLPSGRGLARALARFVREDAAASERAPLRVAANGDSSGRRILEVGPGTGAVTVQIIGDMRPGDRLVLVERNAEFVEHLKRRFAELSAGDSAGGRVSLVHASVEELPEDEPYDVIISGLPLNNFDVELVESILEKLRRLVAPGGTVSFFEYVAVRAAKAIVSPREDRQRLRGIGRVLREFLHRAEIRRDLVLANVPPAWVHHVCVGTRD